MYKYGQRQDLIEPLILLIIYALSVGLLIYFREKLISTFINKSVLKSLYWIIVGICSVIFLFVIINIEGNSLYVDRWSALELSVEGIIHGIYPYSQIDHLGNMTSNFPALGLFALPFYVLGDVGYIQVFTFLLFSFYLYKRCARITTSFYILGLFLLSPALMWEIVVKSDLVSNVMLIILFIEYWTHKYQKNLFQKPILLGSIVAFFLLTRGIIIIPLIIFFIKDFFASELNTKVKFIGSIAIMSLLICLPTFMSVPDWDTFINYNPLVLQTNKTPVLSYLLLLVPFVIPYIIEKQNNYFFYTAIIIFAIPFIAMLNSIAKVGWHLTLFEHHFDISYLTMSIPPILIWIKNHIEVNSQNSFRPAIIANS